MIFSLLPLLTRKPLKAPFVFCAQNKCLIKLKLPHSKGHRLCLPLQKMSAIIAPVLTPTIPGTALTVQIGMGIYDLSTVTLDDTPGSNTSEKKASENLVAELEQMKAMMEQMRLEKEQMRLEKEHMRLEKERYEMEAKRKEEEAAMALRMEQEREMAIKEKKELDVVFSLFRDSPSMWSPDKSNIDYAFENAGEEECKFLRSLEASGETILCVVLDRNALKCSYSVNKDILTIVLTNCHLYKCIYTKLVKTSTSTYSGCGCHTVVLRENCKSLKTGIFYASKLYSFTNPLNLVHAKILSYIVTKPIGVVEFTAHPYQPLWFRTQFGILGMRDEMIAGNCTITTCLKKFESIIRLIPGSYKNGSWRQLDGFFGMYFNETTMELSEVPPPL